ncbi:MAG TPA: ABC transporter permease [Acidimicrobiales bacterium]|nr:ABC transporter permease [Acidimicrobiales bacterium]
MTAYIIRRCIQSLVVVIGVTIIVFVILHLMPGGPARAMLGPRATPAQIHHFIVVNGYNKPIYVQYGHYLDKLIHGNLGYSYHFNLSVNALLAQDLPKSALLVGLSYIVALIVAIPLGILQAVRRNRPIDYTLTGAAFVGYSMPVFWLGILLILGFSVSFHLFPPEGPQGANVGAVIGQPLALVLPVATLSIVTVALFSRFMRSSALENLVQDYIRTARAKGVSERSVLFRHMLRNSLIPVITLIGLSLPFTLSGAVVVEQVFNYPGMGLLFWHAATTKDYPVLLGFCVVVGVAAVVGSLLADILYAVADPRVRYT